MNGLRRTPIIALPVMLLSAAPLGAQTVEVGAFATLVRTGVRELGNPAGLGVSATWPLGDLFGFRLEGTRTSSSPRWTATTCEDYWPLYTDCREETVENDVRGRLVAASLVMVPLRRGDWRLEGTFGASHIYLEHEIAGIESARPLSRSSENEGNFSASFGAAVVREGLAAERLGARLEWRHSRMGGNVGVCPADGYCAPWWEGFGMDEFRLGALWRF